MKFTDKDLQNLIAKIETEFNAHTSKKLVKSEDEMEKPEANEEAPAEEKEVPAQEESSEAPEMKEEAPAEETQDAPAEEPAPEQKPEEEAPANNPLDENDLAELEQLYRSMDKEELQHHLAILNKVVNEQQAPAPEADPMQAQAPDMDQPPVDPMQAQAPDMNQPPVDPMQAPAPEQKPEEMPVFKSLKEENDNLKKSLKELSEAVTSYLGKNVPKQKAVTTLIKAEAPKKVFNREEAKKELSKKIRTSELKKSDRELINRFCVDSTISIDKIEHLLK